MNKLTTDIFRSVYTKLDPKRRLHCMEVFGLDFMIDDEFKPYLIEVNTNPCLELASPLLSRLIPTVIENALKIGLDAIFLLIKGIRNMNDTVDAAIKQQPRKEIWDTHGEGHVRYAQKNHKYGHIKIVPTSWAPGKKPVGATQ